MISPSITDLTKNEFNRYTLAIATAKCARMITDEYVRQREIAERKIANKETDKSIASMVNREYRDEKAVKVAVHKLHKKDFVILGYTDKYLECEAECEDAANEENGEN